MAAATGYSVHDEAWGKSADNLLKYNAAGFFCKQRLGDSCQVLLCECQQQLHQAFQIRFRLDFRLDLN